MLGKIMSFAVSRSLATGSKFFTTISAIAMVFRFVQKISGNAPKTLFVHEMKDGETLVVSELLKKK